MDKATNILIVSTWRSGAGSFLAQLLNQYPETFYAEEPFKLVGGLSKTRDKFQLIKGTFINHLDTIFVEFCTL